MAEHDKMAIIDDAKTIENEVPLTEEQRRRLEEFIEEEEGALNRYKGVLAVIMTAAAVLMSLFHLYAAVEIVPAYILRPVHVAEWETDDGTERRLLHPGDDCGPRCGRTPERPAAA